MPQGIVKPSNQIVAAGDPFTIEMEIGANATAVDMIPGCVVIFDTTDQTVKEAGAKAKVDMGVLDVVASKQVTEAYAVGDQVPVILGECICVLTLLAAENVTRGDPLVTAAAGKVAKLAVGAMGAQGRVIGYAWESSNVTTDAKILVHWKPAADAAAAS